MMEMKLMKTSPLPLEAILALMNQCRALALSMTLLEVAYFCAHPPLMKSMIKSVWGSFMPARLNGPLSIFHQCIAFGCSSSRVIF